MTLSTDTLHPRLRVVWTAPTVFAPSTALRVELRLEPRDGDALTIERADWRLPPAMAPVEDPAEPPFPLAVPAGGAEITLTFSADAQTFGEMGGALIADGQPIDLTPVWVSAFEPRVEADPSGLSDEGRQRLVAVVNARDRNGHIFMADYAAFFEDFLHLQLPSEIAERINEELGGSLDELPVDPERRLQIIRGEVTFYGIEQLRLMGDEECEDDDERPFDTSAAREVPTPDLT